MVKRDLQKFNPHPGFRPYQEETINKIIDAIDKGYHNIIVEAPVGSGKSVIGYMVAKYLSETRKTNQDDQKGKWRNYIVSPQNILLDQYEREFVTGEQKNMAMIKGGDNYACPVNKKTYNDGPCHVSGKSQKSLGCYNFCPYIKARNLARNHIITLSNFHYLLLEFDFVQQMGKRDLAIFDEAHNIEKVMMDYRAVKLGQFMINKINTIINNINTGDTEFWQKCRAQVKNVELLSVDEFVKGMVEDDHPRNIKIVKERIHDIFSQKISFLISTIRSVVESEYKALEMQGHSFEAIAKMLDQNGYTNAKRSAVDLTRMLNNLGQFSNDIDKAEWVVAFERDKMNKIVGVEIKPVTVQFLVKDTLLRMSEYRIFMSATICGHKTFAKNLGLDLNDTVFISVPSTFPTETRPFNVIPVAYMNYKEMEKNLPKMVQMIDEIISQNPGVKGIVHTVSFKNAEYLMRNSKHRRRMITHKSGNKNEVLELFYNSKDLILLSPSSLEGLDLKGDLSRFQIFMKVPYLSLGDKQVKRRMEIDMPWYIYMTVLSIVQGSGRSMRSADDHCQTYMLDANFKRLYAQGKEMFPEDFKGTIVWI